MEIICTDTVNKPQSQIPCALSGTQCMRNACSVLCLGMKSRKAAQAGRVVGVCSPNNKSERKLQTALLFQKELPPMALAAHNYSEIITGSSPCQGFGLIKVSPKVKFKCYDVYLKIAIHSWNWNLQQELCQSTCVWSLCWFIQLKIWPPAGEVVHQTAHKGW